MKPHKSHWGEGLLLLEKYVLSLPRLDALVVFRPHLPQEGATHVPFHHPSADI